ncbi:glycosyltransferase family 4 protein [Paraburkholderia phytofirmans]|uniref:glycosyltransferase family 4 protein n=1 Tax=Paraburkholderia phytofirmans TaxID=261302 RepID=UPI0038B77BDA
MKRSSNQNTPHTVIQLGPSLTAQGGIASVLSGYASYQAGFTRLGYRLVFIASCGEAGRSWILTFISAWCRLILLSLLGEVSLVHIHSATKGSLLRKSILALTCMVIRKRYVIHVHNGAFANYYMGLPGSVRALVRLVLRNATSVICLSAHAREQFIAMKLAVPEKCQLVYNGINDPFEQNLKLSDPSREVALSFLGKLCEAKGIVTLFEALALLPQSAPGYRLFVGGSGEAGMLSKWISQYGLSERVVCMGWIEGEEKNCLLRNTEIFVLPSRSEGFSVAILEAMAFGIAVVSTRIPGVVDAIRQGKDGLLVRPDDVAGLRDAILQLLNDATARQRFGASARQRFLDHFTIQRTALHLASVYEGAMR